MEKAGTTKMQSYKVPAWSESVSYIRVNASSPAEAEAMAMKIDGGAFRPEECYDWRIGNAEEDGEAEEGQELEDYPLL